MKPVCVHVHFSEDLCAAAYGTHTSHRHRSRRTLPLFTSQKDSSKFIYFRFFFRELFKLLYCLFVFYLLPRSTFPIIRPFEMFKPRKRSKKNSLSTFFFHRVLPFWSNSLAEKNHQQRKNSTKYCHRIAYLLFIDSTSMCYLFFVFFFATKVHREREISAIKWSIFFSIFFAREFDWEMVDKR